MSVLKSQYSQESPFSSCITNYKMFHTYELLTLFNLNICKYITLNYVTCTYIILYKLSK